jgi:RHS repeat-associated protein
MLRNYIGLRLPFQITILLIPVLFPVTASWADAQFDVSVEGTLSGPLSGVKVYGFTESGAYTGKSATTDPNGQAFFDGADFEAGSYQFRVDYLGQRFWSDPVDLPDEIHISVVIQEEHVVANVTDGAYPMEGIRVYLFSSAGAYLGVYGDTEANGDVGFNLPMETVFKFRADMLGYQFWSDEIAVEYGTTVDLWIEHQDVEATVHGLSQNGIEPIEGIKVYLFKPPGSYLGRNRMTDADGRVIFSLPERPYTLRADYMGQQFWSEAFVWQDPIISFPLADVQVGVIGSGLPLEGVRIYVFSETGSYLGVYDTSDSGGQVFFRLPTGKYKFRVDYQGSQYWAEKTLNAEAMNSVEISTGGGSFTFRAVKSETEPLTGVKCYVFSESGAYLGLNASTDDDGQARFDLSDGSYKIRTDYLGYRFWSDVFEIPESLSQTLQISHAEVGINVEGVYQGDAEPIENVKIYLFTPGGSYLGQNRITDGTGMATFSLPERPYKVRADYLGRQFWSEEFTWQDTAVSVPMSYAMVTVAGNGLALEDVPVYVFSESGSYLGLSNKTDSEGQVLFRLAAGAYKFRADHQGSQYWAEMSLSADQVTPVEISTGGGRFTFTVLSGETDPLVEVKCYVFSDSGSYLGIYKKTDENGQVTFDLSDGYYKFRIDYLGYPYWSDVYTVPNMLSDIYIIAHHEVTITVQGLYEIGTPLEGLKVYLFTPSGAYLGQYVVTSAEGKVTLNLPDQPYKVRVDYLGRQYWSDGFQSVDTTITINEGEAEVHVHHGGEDVDGAKVYLFSQEGAYLGKYKTTDAFGIAKFLLPDRSFQFRVDEGGTQYWSPIIEIIAGTVNSLEIDLSPTAVSISANPDTILVGGSSTLTWSATNAYACEIEPGIGSVDVSGSIDVFPEETTQFVVTATGPGGAKTDSVEVIVTTEIKPPADLDYGLASDEQEGGGGLVGETIRLLNGNTTETRSDLSFPSPNSLGLSFAATYNSRSSILSSLGTGWTHTYDVTLYPDFRIGGNYYLKILGPTGRAFYFQEDIPGIYSGVFHERSHVQAETEGYVWYCLDGTGYRFSSEGKLMWIEDEKGNRLDLAYDQNGRLNEVTDTASNRSLRFNYNESGLMESISGPATAAVSNGIWVFYGYDAHQNLISVTYADGSGFNYGYTDLQDVHNLSEKRNKAGHLLNTWTYDNLDRCVDNFSAEGKGLSVNYLNEAQVSVTDAYGTVRIYSLVEIDGRLRLKAMQGITLAPYTDSNASRWVYDAAMRLIEVEYGESSHGTINGYEGFDDRGNPSNVRLAVGTEEEQVIAYTYHPQLSQVLTRSEPSVLGNGEKVTIWDYDDDYDGIPNENPKRLISQIFERGFTKNTAANIVPYEYVTVFTYNTKGQILTVDGPLPGSDDTTAFAYDAATGDLLSVTRPVVGTSEFTEYDTAGRVGRIVDVNGQARSFVYDGKGRVKKTLNSADGSTVNIEYNLAGSPDSATDEDGIPRIYVYDAIYGRLSRIVDRDGNYIAYAYDAQGNKTEMGKYDAADFRTSRKRWNYQHPVFPGRLWKEIRADNSFLTYDYDTSGNVFSVTDYEGQTTVYDYDVMNRLSAVEQPGNVLTTYAYDKHGNLISLKDGEDHQTAFIYDDMGRIISTASPDTGTIVYVYDAAGNQTEKTDAMGITTIYNYDSINRLMEIHFPDSAQDIIYTYDEGLYGRGFRTGMSDPSGSTAFEYDKRGRLVGKTSTVMGITYALTRTYTAGGRLSSMVYPGDRTVNYARYPNGKIQGVSTTSESITTTLIDNILYKPFGKPTGLTAATGGTVSNQSSDCDCLEAANPGEKMEQIYTYDENRNLTSIRGTNTPGFNQDFAYDPLNRLTNSTGTYGTISYTYDKAQNRLTRTVDGQTETYTYAPGSNKLKEISGDKPISFSHDANGNTTVMGDKTIVYNHNNRILRAEEGGHVLGTYTYNGLGQRVSKLVDGVATIFHYDFEGNVIGESSADGLFSNEYLYLGASRTAKVNVESGEIFFYHNNYLGTPLLMTDDRGTVVWEATYKPFGEATVNPNCTVVNNFRFPGQYYDQETGLHYNYHRYYDPRSGRYLTPDPSHSAQAEENNTSFLSSFPLNSPFELNPYHYVRNNPLRLIDPKGLDCGPGKFGDFIIPDKPGGYDFSDCCRRHDDCYSGKHNQCTKTKEHCDEEFYQCMKRICNISHLASRKCQNFASMYWYYVGKYGLSSFQGARNRGPCGEQCENQ